MLGWLWLALTLVVAGLGLALVTAGLRAALLPIPHRRFLGFRPALEAIVRWRLGGYRHAFNTPDRLAPIHAERTHRVAVVGGGIAGLAAASILAERGITVTLFERNAYLGGKIGAWPVQFDDGRTVTVEHGFHAFFGQYYNLNRFLRETLGIFDRFRAIEEYAILRTDGSKLSFNGVDPAPALNLVHLTLKGLYDWRPIVRDPMASKRMEALLRYDADTTFTQWDDTTFAQFAEQAKLDPDLAVSFTSFSRAFFADPDRMSMAELIKSFHFYYLSHDCGLDYVFPVDDYETAVLGPWRAHLERHRVQLQLNADVERISRVDGGFEVDAERFDEVVLACHVPGVRAIMDASPDLVAEDPDLARRVGMMTVGQRYAVLRVWLDQDIRDGLPMFVVTDRADILDSVTTYHRYETDSMAWVRERGGGSVLELHCYAVPDNAVEDVEVRDRLVSDLRTFFPEIRDAKIVREAFQCRNDFPAFHAGLWRHRPSGETAIAGLHLAGDWVKLPFPAMLMEAAFSSGLLAANRILEGQGLRAEPVEHVPLKGLLAGVPGGDVPE